MKDSRELNERQRDILRSIVNLYILKATPVGSRPLSKYLEGKLDLSPATIRNIMSDLEEMEYISHPHTSAGRIPTDKGYRFYVNSLRKIEQLSEGELISVKEQIVTPNLDSESMLHSASKIIGLMSNYLAVVKLPNMLDVLIHRLEIIAIASDRLLLVLALDSNLIRTITLETHIEFELGNISTLSQFINEKIAGKTLRFLRENFGELMKDYQNPETPLIRLFVDSADKIFQYTGLNDKIITSGTHNLLSHPEFEDLSKVKTVIELIENEEIIIHLLDNNEESKSDLQVLIGSELRTEAMEDYSVVMSSYKIGSVKGTVGLIGPKRMNYAKMISIVAGVSNLLSQNK